MNIIYRSINYFISLSVFLTLAGCGASSKFVSGQEENQGAAAKQNVRYGLTDPNPDSLLNEGRFQGFEPLETVEAVASYYANKFHGRETSSGEVYDKNEISAAHIKYPLGTIVRVTNQKNNKSIIVEINDRKPDGNGRAIDLSRRAAEEIGMVRDGLAKVLIEVLEWGSGKN